MAIKKPTLVNFEKSLIELEALVERMEKGDLTLEDALKHFERGVQLTRSCQSALQLAEQRVEKLMTENGEATLVAFKSESEN
jgi:exodeoxyribonuclease VII small subunit